MSAQINHVAIVSDNYAQLAKFYEAIFGMKSSELQRAASPTVTADAARCSSEDFIPKMAS